MRERVHIYLPPAPTARELDYQLACDALQGDQGAWNTLYQEALPLVISGLKKFDYHRIFSACDYDDAADEAFAMCYEHLNRYRGRGRFYCWVLGYGKNIMRHRYRRQVTARRNQYLLENMALSRAGNQDPLRLLIRLERDRCLWEAFSRLTLSEKTVLWQQVFMNIPPRRLAKRLHLTRRQAQQCYQDALFKLRWHYSRLYP